MKDIKILVVMMCGLLTLPFLLGFTINGVAPGAAASMTAIAVGSTTPVAVATCSTTTTCRRKAIEFDVITANNCYGVPAAASSPCAAASPAPNSSTKVGVWILGPSKWTYRADKDINPSDASVCAEWDWVCDGSASMSHLDLP